MRLLPRSLQGRLLAGLLGAVLAVWLATALATWRDARHELDELLDGHLAQAAALLVAQQAGAPDDDDPGLDAPQLHRYAPRVVFQVWHGDQLALRSANAPATPMLADAALQALARRPRTAARDPEQDAGHGVPQGAEQHGAGRTADAGSGFATGLTTVVLDRSAWRVFAARGAERDIRVFVGERLDARSAILRAVLRSTLWPMALALPLLALAAWWVVGLGTAPLRDLSRSLAARDPRALEPLPAVDPPAEMAPLLAALNRLFERIGAMVEAERRFTADAAHELRTPIAAIRTQAQVALAETDAAARAHALRATLAGCDRASRLVAQLLTLSRLEACGAAADAALDLAALARQVAAELAPQALARGQQLSLEADAPCPVRADATLTAVLLRNLVDNALRYSPDGAAVRISVRADSGAVLLQVDDGGPGLDPADRQRLGERFFRVLGSGRDGSGLGWSIVRRIAAAQGATVAVAASDPATGGLGGLAVTLRWPAA